MNVRPPYAPRPDGFHPQLDACARMMQGLGAAMRPPTREDVLRALRKPRLDDRDFALLLSPAAGEELEAMAQRARAETLCHFGKARQLFAPLYLANYCTNRCVYCGFHAGQPIERRALSQEAIEEEARALAATGLRRVLTLTGDDPERTGAAYIAEGVALLARYFPSVGIEVQALTGEEYARVVEAGADSMTMFQETYDPKLYARLHLAGPKRDFAFRLDAPERAAEAGIRGITMGVLLGLGDWRFDVFMAGMHGQWLQRRFPQLDVAFSLPRIQPRCGEESRDDVGMDGGRSVFELRIVTDREFVQALTALRCFMPHAGITLSTRERAFLRDKLLDLGVTKLSAGVSTAVGGYADSGAAGGSAGSRSGADAVQFVIDDERSVARMAADLEALGFQPVFADWVLPRDGAMPLAEALCRSLGNVTDTPGAA